MIGQYVDVLKVALDEWLCVLFTRCLSDIDVDGNLSPDEFCVAMYLIDLAKMGQLIPAVLPPGIIPPAYRKLRRPSETGASVASPAAVTGVLSIFNIIIIHSLIFSLVTVLSARVAVIVCYSVSQSFGDHCANMSIFMFSLCLAIVISFSLRTVPLLAN